MRVGIGIENNKEAKDWITISILMALGKTKKRCDYKNGYYIVSPNTDNFPNLSIDEIKRQIKFFTKDNILYGEWEENTTKPTYSG